MYYAYNNEGWKFSLSYYEDDKEMHITLDAPMEMSNIEWPITELAQLLPIPKSTKGKISTDTSDRLYVYIGNTSIEDYNTYVNECYQKGFSVDYDKSEKYYDAKNANGYELSLNYTGGEVMTIEISKPENAVIEEDTNKDTNGTQNLVDNQDDANENSTTQNQSQETTSTTNLVNGMRQEFKAAMDSYESFMNEYYDFMKNIVTQTVVI